jgi:hypothetical protein
VEAGIITVTTVTMATTEDIITACMAICEAGTVVAWCHSVLVIGSVALMAAATTILRRTLVVFAAVPAALVLPLLQIPLSRLQWTLLATSATWLQAYPIKVCMARHHRQWLRVRVLALSVELSLVTAALEGHLRIPVSVCPLVWQGPAVWEHLALTVRPWDTIRTWPMATLVWELPAVVVAVLTVVPPKLLSQPLVVIKCHLLVRDLSPTVLDQEATAPQALDRPVPVLVTMATSRSRSSAPALDN